MFVWEGRGKGRVQEVAVVGCIRMFLSHSAFSYKEVTAVSEVVKAMGNDFIEWFEPPRKINSFFGHVESIKRFKSHMFLYAWECLESQIFIIYLCHLKNNNCGCEIK